MNLREELVAQALAEFSAMGGAKEPGANSSQSKAKTDLAHALIKKYWMDGVNYSSAAAISEINKRTAWSAAFISYCMRQALAQSGDAAKFDFSPSHSVYIGQSLRNDFNLVPKPAFYGEPPTGIGKVKPMVGDLIANTRTANIADYGDALAAARALPKPNTYFSHCDIVVDITGNTLTMIGGNVSNSVSRTIVTLDSGGFLPYKPFKYDSAGKVISGPYIAIIQHR